jgi:hypothetical protein
MILISRLKPIDGQRRRKQRKSCLTLQNQEEGKKLNGKNSQKHSKQGSDCIKVKLKKVWT